MIDKQWPFDGQFNEWWDSEYVIEDNPYQEDTPAFWAWEGWSAGRKAEREACAKLEAELSYVNPKGDAKTMFYNKAISDFAAAIRARGEK